MRLTSVVALLTLLAACSGKSSDLSTLTLSASPTSAPADGMTQITITITAKDTDGSTPYSGQVELSCAKNVQFGGATQSGTTDTITITNGTGSDTVVCAAGANCVGQDTIRGSLFGGSAGATSNAIVTFTASGASTTSGTSGTTSTSGTITGTGGTFSGTSSGTGGASTATNGVTSGTTGGRETTGASSGTVSGATGSGNTSGTTGTVDAGPPPPGGIKFKSATNPYLGIDYETPNLPNNFPVNTFSFEVTDVTGNTAVAGASVDFTPGSSNAQGSHLVGGDGGLVTVVSDANGLASVQVNSGQKTGPITVTASVEGTNFSTQGTSAVVGTQPSLAHSTISCTPANLAVYTGGHLPCESSSPIAKTTTCTVTLADRFNYAVEVPVAVQFFTEAGNFQRPSVQTPSFGQTNPGTVSNTLDTTGNLPEDVDPLPAVPGQAAEPSYTDYCSTNAGHVYNPRDGLVTIIAVFEGEESFFLGPTGVYEPGDEFVDMPQPFVDANDNSVWDPAPNQELCAGNSAGGVCGGPNGAWDANSDVFVQTRIVYSGSAVNTTALPPQNSSIQFSSPGPADGGLIVAHMATGNGHVTWADINFNTSEASATYAVTFLSGPSGVSVTFPVSGTPGTSPDTLSMEYTPLIACDAGSVSSDAGMVPSTICYFETAITDFSGGFSGTYSVSNNAQAPGAFSILASEHVEADLVSNPFDGTAL